MSCKSTMLPLLLERVGERRIKTTSYVSLIPAHTLNGEGVGTCVDTYVLREGAGVREYKSQVISYAILSSICFTRLS